MIKRLAALLVCITAIITLGYGIGSAKLTSPFSDPIGKVRAQDEAVYANASVSMAASGDWLTPRFLDRFLLYKPPLMIWLCATSIKAFGMSESILRLPALLAAVLATVVLFLWCQNARSTTVGVAVVILLLSTPLWHTFARLCYTDMIWTCLSVCALACVFFDPPLARTRSQIAFGVAIGLTIMVKNVAGTAPIFVVILHNAMAARELRTPVRALLRSVAIAVLIAAPWHLYQLVWHTEWFWMDYVQIQLLGFGLRPPTQPIGDVQRFFYLTRLLKLDPVLTVLASIGVVVCFYNAIRRERLACLLTAWLVVVLVMLAAFQYRNLPYALGLIPPLAVAASIYGLPNRYTRAAVAALACIFAVKIAFPNVVWGLNFGRLPPQPAVAAVDSYVRLARRNDLVLAGADDDFYSATTRISKLRYYFFDPTDVVSSYAPHYRALGITLTVDEVRQLDKLESSYVAALRQWGLSSPEPIGTAIVSRTPDGLQRLMDLRPDWDALVRSGDAAQLSGSIGRTHDSMPLPNGYVALLSKAGLR